MLTGPYSLWRLREALLSFFRAVSFAFLSQGPCLSLQANSVVTHILLFSHLLFAWSHLSPLSPKNSCDDLGSTLMAYPSQDSRFTSTKTFSYYWEHLHAEGLRITLGGVIQLTTSCTNSASLLLQILFTCVLCHHTIGSAFSVSSSSIFASEFAKWHLAILFLPTVAIDSSPPASHHLSQLLFNYMANATYKSLFVAYSFKK